VLLCLLRSSDPSVSKVVPTAVGYESPKVLLAGQDFKRSVAMGALNAAR